MSAWETSAMAAGGEAKRIFTIDTTGLSALVVVPTPPPPGHFSIRPARRTHLTKA